MSKPLVYVAGPYAKPDPVENTHRAIRVGSCLAEDGKCTPVIPHLSLLWHAIDPHPVEFWYAYDLELMARCDYVLRLPGESAGADVEVTQAEAQGIPVFFAIGDLYRAIESESK